MKKLLEIHKAVLGQCLSLVLGRRYLWNHEIFSFDNKDKCRDLNLALFSEDHKVNSKSAIQEKK